MVETTEPEQLVKAYVDVWNEQDYSTIPDVVSESFVLYDPAAPEEGVPGPKREVHGPDGLELFIRGVVTRFPDFHVNIIDVLSSGDLVMYEGKITMTHEGEFDGIPPTGQEVEIRTMSTYRIEDGEIQEHRVYFNQQEVFEQLGLAEE
jgi:steroid delta-isomerase-like uncharacterized protein